MGSTRERVNERRVDGEDGVEQLVREVTETSRTLKSERFEFVEE